MFRYLILSLFTIGSLEQALAGSITIEADLDIDNIETPRIQIKEGTKRGKGYSHITGLSKCSVTYEQDQHRFIIKDLTYDFLRQKKEQLHLTESPDKIVFTLTTKYTPYTIGHSEEEPSYQHNFTVTIPTGVHEDQTITACLDRIAYAPPYQGGGTYPAVQVLYNRSGAQ